MRTRSGAVAPEVGGGFGAKINIYGEEYVAAAVSKTLGLPVKWVEDRSEAFVATVHGRGIIGYVDLAAQRDGTVLGLKLRLIADIGAYDMLLTANIPTSTMTMASGTYAIPAIRATLTEVFTNKTRPTPIAGQGVLRRHIFSSGRWICWRGSCRSIRPIFAGRTSSNQSSFPTRPRCEPSTTRATTRRPWIVHLKPPVGSSSSGSVMRQGPGVVLSVLVYRCMWRSAVSVRHQGCRRVGWEHSLVTVERDGRVSATTGVSPHGQGNETTFAQMLADQFGVPIEHITIHHGDTAVAKHGIGTFGSRSQAVGGTALHLAGAKVKMKMARFAAALLEANEEDLVFENCQIAVRALRRRPSRSPRSRGTRTTPPSSPRGSNRV